MPRKPIIRWGESDAKELEERVRKFNAKIYRTRHRHPELADVQPETIKKEDKQRLIEEFKEMPRSEFNKFMNSLERYGRRGAEKAVTNEQGVSTTKWKVKEVEIKTATANREKARERAEYNIELPTGKLMGSTDQNALRPSKFDFNRIKSKKELEYFERAVKKIGKANYLEEKIDTYKRNYLASIERNLGSAGRQLYDFINNVPADTLYGMFYDDDPVLRIQFTSDPLPTETITYESFSHWERALGAHDFNKYMEGVE